MIRCVCMLRVLLCTDFSQMCYMALANLSYPKSGTQYFSKDRVRMEYNLRASSHVQLYIKLHLVLFLLVVSGGKDSLCYAAGPKF